MPQHSRFARFYSLVALMYLSILGATFNGVVGFVELQPFTLGIFGVGAAVWLVSHARKGGRWHITPMHGLFVMWAIVILIATLANIEVWRRSAEGAWYVLLYMAVWMLFADLVLNGRLSRDHITATLLLNSLLIVAFAYFHLIDFWLNTGEVIRPNGVLGNPNVLAGVLSMLFPLALVTALRMKVRAVRYVLLLYALVIFVLQLFAASRGAWVATGASVVVFAALWLLHHDMLGVATLRSWWQQQTQQQRIVVGSGVATVAIVGVIMAGIVLNSFNLAGRAFSLRAFLWESAITQFTEKPLAGYGLFTYGRQLSGDEGIPPQQSHSHAHSIPLNVAAEMGMLGIAALAISIIMIARVWWRNWQTKQDRFALMGGMVALIGFCVHHLVDTPAMMPIVALHAVLVLVLVATPIQPSSTLEPQQPSRQWAQALGVAAIWAVLIGAGFWANSIHQQYRAVIGEAYEDEAWHSGGDAMQAVIDSDPNMPIYTLQQAYLYGLAAAQGDVDALSDAITAYERYLAFEPYHAANWANLAALYYQRGDDDAAQQAIANAVLYAPAWDHFQWQQAVYSGNIVDDDVPIDIPRRDGTTYARLQFLREFIVLDRDKLGEYLPQVGWGTRG